MLKIWLGVSNNIVQFISYWVITMSVNIISSTNVQRLTNIEIQTDTYKSIMTEYDISLEQRLNVKDEDLTKIIHGVNNYNRFSPDDFDTLFMTA